MTSPEITDRGQASGSLSSTGHPLTRTDWAEQALRRSILSGELRPGERMVSAVLEQRLNVSQTPIREALQRLAAVGLIEINAQQGAFVAPVSLREMLEIYEVRLALDPLAVEKSVPVLGPGALETITKSHGALLTALRADEPQPDVIEFHHHRFHTEIIAACDSQWLRRLCQQLGEHSARYRLLSWGARRAGGEAIAEHDELLDAVLARDGVLAAEITRRHLQATVDINLDAEARAQLAGTFADVESGANER